MKDPILATFLVETFGDMKCEDCCDDPTCCPGHTKGRYDFILNYDSTKTMEENIKRSDAVLDKIVPKLHKTAARRAERQRQALKRLIGGQHDL